MRDRLDPAAGEVEVRGAASGPGCARCRDPSATSSRDRPPAGRGRDEEHRLLRPPLREVIGDGSEPFGHGASISARRSHQLIDSLAGVVARPHQRARLHVREAHRLRVGPDRVELGRCPPACDRQVLRARPQVLAERHDVDADCRAGRPARRGPRRSVSPMPRMRPDFVTRPASFARREHRQRARVARRRTRRRVGGGQPSRGCGSARRAAPRRSWPSEPASPFMSEISSSTAVVAARGAHRVDRGREHRRATVGKVVARDARDHDVREAERATPRRRPGAARRGRPRAACACRPGRTRTRRVQRSPRIMNVAVRSAQHS